jgi:hypothetical protein
MSRFCFYNPHGGATDDAYAKSGKSLPSLDATWAHWEHIMPARYYTDEKMNNSQSYMCAKLGERKRPTELYLVWKTLVKELMAFGVSVRMYFNPLLTFCVFLFVAGVLNLPLVWYFWNYTEEGFKQGISNAIKGLAICDQTEWVQCDNCDDESLQGPIPKLQTGRWKCLRQPLQL